MCECVTLTLLMTGSEACADYHFITDLTGHRGGWEKNLVLSSVKICGTGNKFDGAAAARKSFVRHFRVILFKAFLGQLI